MLPCLKRIILLPLLLCAACSPTQQVAELSNEFREEYRALPDYDSLPIKRISWAEAMAKAQQGNLEYLRLQQEYTKAKRQTKRVLREVIPVLDIGEYYNAPLKWGSGEPAQSLFDVNVIFNLPGLVTLPVEHYTDALAAIKADTDCKLKQRELTARLYKCFREHRLQERSEALSGEKAEGSDARKRLLREQHTAKRRAQWAELSKLMNDYSARWEPDGRDMPRVVLADYRERMQAPDELLLAVMALQYEASRLSKLGAALRFAPSVHIGFFSPSLFTSSGGETDGFMSGAEDVRVNLNAYMRLDTRLDMYHDYRNAEQAHELTRRQLSQQLREHKEKLALLMESWEKYEEWKDSVAAYVSFRNRRGVAAAEEAMELHGESLDIEQGMIEQERANLERECALLQEYGVVGR